MTYNSLAKCYDKAKQILKDNRDKLDMLTQALLDQETLNRAEFVSLMETGMIPEGVGGDKPRTAEEVISESREANTEETKKENDQPSADEAVVTGEGTEA